MTGGAPPPLRWWGWGEREVHIPSGLLELLRDRLDVSGEVVSRPPALDQIAMPDPALPAALRERLAAVLGDGNIHDDRETRVRHAAGRSYTDLIRLRSGRLEAAPDAVAFPGSAKEVDAVLRACSDAACAVVPFGGGTSVVGGVDPVRGGCGSLLSLDLARLDSVSGIDPVSMYATVGAGVRGPRIEAELGAAGLTLGHFPQSFEYASAGGFAATRSAGQASALIGRFDELVRGVRMSSPSGGLNVEAVPSTAAGPSLLQLVLGSEGTLGVITEVTVRVRSRPPLHSYRGWSLPSFEAGVAVLRELAQGGRLPDVARLADEAETGVTLTAAGTGAAARAGVGYLRLRGHGRGCLLVLGWEGDGAAIGARARLAAPVLRRGGAVALGGAPGRAWLRSRFEAPYLRDSLLDRGVLAETLETASPWSRLTDVRRAVVGALEGTLRARGTPALVGCHVSHIYTDGASLYFTVLARQDPGQEVEQWGAAKRAATDALLAAGATLTHHHGVGADHRGWMRREVGDRGVAALEAMRLHFDPGGVMNPGKLTGTAAG